MLRNSTGAVTDGELVSALCRANGIANCCLMAAGADSKVPAVYLQAMWALSATIADAMAAAGISEPEQPPPTTCT